MPRAKIAVAAQSVEKAPSPKKTRSSSRVSKKSSKNMSSSQPSKPKGESKGKLKLGKETVEKIKTPKISVETKKGKASSEKKTPVTVERAEEKTPKNRSSARKEVVETNSDSAGPSSLNQSLTRKSVRSKKETSKFSEWKEKGTKTKNSDAAVDKSKSEEDSKKQKKANQSNLNKSKSEENIKKHKKASQSIAEDEEVNTKDGEGPSKNNDKAQTKSLLRKSRGRSQTEIVPAETGAKKAVAKGKEVSDKSATKSPVRKISQKRKLSQIVTEAELDDSSKKVKISPTKKKSPVKRYRSIASSLSKVQQKNAPRKTLGNRDILGLLDEDPEDEEVNQNDLEPEPEKTPNMSSSFSKSKPKIPVWRQQHQEPPKAEQTLVGDVFDPMNYGEEEFGPEDESVHPVKKKVKKKKKDTKAILVFGKNQSNGIKNVVKEAHNLKTPGAGKKTKKMTSTKSKAAGLDMFPSEVPGNPAVISTFNSDLSTGAQNYFDSELNIDNGEQNNPPTDSVVENLPQKRFTPKVPKINSRLNAGSCSTPLHPHVTRQKPVAATVKEQMKNAFGFDDTEDEDEMNESVNNSISISPVKKVKNPVLDMFEGDSILEGRGTARLSTIPGLTAGGGVTAGKRAAPVSRPPVEIVSRTKETGPFRVNLPLRSKTVEIDLLAQVRVLREKEMERQRKEKPKSTRSSPRKKLSRKNPITSSALLEDPETAPKQKNIREMFEAVKSKQSREEEQVVDQSASEASSLYDDLSLVEETDQKEEAAVEKSDKENVTTNSPSPVKNVRKHGVSKVYKRKKDVTSNCSTTSTFIRSPDQSSKLGSPKRETKKVKAFNQWAKHQTSHFSEVEDFDLSFT